MSTSRRLAFRLDWLLLLACLPRDISPSFFSGGVRSDTSAGEGITHTMSLPSAAPAPPAAAVSPSLESASFLVAEVGGSSPTALSYHELVNAFAAGHVTATSLIYHPDVTAQQWLPLQSVPSVARALAVPFVPLPLPASPALPFPASTSAEGNRSWYYVDTQGRTVGPASAEELLAAAAAGLLTDGSLVWQDGMTAWKRRSEVTELRGSQPASNAGSDEEKQLPVTEMKAATAARGEEETKETAAGDEDDDDDDGEPEDAAPAAAGQRKHSSSTAVSSAYPVPKRKKGKRKRPSSSSSVYATGLPADLSESEAFDFFRKGGVIREDVLTGEKRIRLYSDASGRRKGDALVSYMFPDSVPLAITLLDGAEIRPGCPVSVTEASFQQSAASSQPAPVAAKKSKVELTLAKRRKELALSWEGDDSTFSSPLLPAAASSSSSSAVGLRIVVLKHCFSPSEVPSSPTESDAFFSELTSDIGTELERRCGEVEKLTVYEHSDDGVLIVKFASCEAAERCVDVMKGRFYAGRALQVEWFDGTDYSKRETAEEERRRLEEFGAALEAGKL